MISFLGTSITFAQTSLVIPDENCFTISTDGEITEYDKNCPTALEIPTTIGGIEVQRIGPRAFKEREITEIKLPSTLKSIGKGAFAENQLNSVELPSGLERIEN